MLVTMNMMMKALAMGTTDADRAATTRLSASTLPKSRTTRMARSMRTTLTLR
jgi:hypothetical protein